MFFRFVGSTNGPVEKRWVRSKRVYKMLHNRDSHATKIEERISERIFKTSIELLRTNGFVLWRLFFHCPDLLRCNQRTLRARIHPGQCLPSQWKMRSEIPFPRRRWEGWICFNVEFGIYQRLNGSSNEAIFFQPLNVEIRPLSSVGMVEVSDDLPCKLCEQLVSHLRDLLVANTTESEFQMILEGMCKQTKSFASEVSFLFITNN